MTVHVLERDQTIDRPLAEVFPFFENAANLKHLVPDSLRFTILSPEPIPMRAGAIIDYRIRLSGVPMRWRTEITEYEPPHRFVDVQRKGPYKLWRHEHTFEELPDGKTRMRDRVEYDVGWGPLGPLAHGLFVKRMLTEIFDYRHERTIAIFEKGELDENGSPIVPT